MGIKSKKEQIKSEKKNLKKTEGVFDEKVWQALVLEWEKIMEEEVKDLLLEYQNKKGKG